MTMSGPPPRRLRHALCSLHFLIAKLSARPNSPDLDIRQQVNPEPTRLSTSSVSPLLTTSDISKPSLSPVSSIAPIQPPFMPTSSDSLPSSPSASLSTFVSPNDGNDEEVDRTSGIVNLYFLLLGVFIAVLILIYWILARRRRGRKLASATRRQDALAADLSRGPSIGGYNHGQIGTQTAVSNGGSRFGRWRTAMGVPRAESPEREEGLNERGEAPPPYLAKLPKAVTVEGRVEDDEEAVELHNMGQGGGVRPPDYSPPSTSAGRARL